MSAIGHYIHFSKKGYEEHGTTRSGAFNDPNISYQRQKQMLQQQIEEIFNVEQKELQNIAEIIKYLFFLVNYSFINYINYTKKHSKVFI